MKGLKNLKEMFSEPEGDQLNLPFKEVKSEFDIEINRVVELFKKLNEARPQFSISVLGVYQAVLSVMVERNVSKKYKDSYKVCGLQGILFQCLHKNERLKNLLSGKDRDFNFSTSQMVQASLSDDGTITDNGIAAHLIDEINYSILALAEMIEVKNKELADATTE